MMDKLQQKELEDAYICAQLLSTVVSRSSLYEQSERMHIYTDTENDTLSTDMSQFTYPIGDLSKLQKMQTAVYYANLPSVLREFYAVPGIDVAQETFIAAQKFFLSVEKVYFDDGTFDLAVNPHDLNKLQDIFIQLSYLATDKKDKVVSKIAQLVYNHLSLTLIKSIGVLAAKNAELFELGIRDEYTRMFEKNIQLLPYLGDPILHWFYNIYFINDLSTEDILHLLFKSNIVESVSKLHNIVFSLDFTDPGHSYFHTFASKIFNSYIVWLINSKEDEFLNELQIFNRNIFEIIEEKEPKQNTSIFKYAILQLISIDGILEEFIKRKYTSPTDSTIKLVQDKFRPARTKRKLINMYLTRFIDLYAHYSIRI